MLAPLAGHWLTDGILASPIDQQEMLLSIVNDKKEPLILNAENVDGREEICAPRNERQAVFFSRLPLPVQCTPLRSISRSQDMPRTKGLIDVCTCRH